MDRPMLYDIWTLEGVNGRRYLANLHIGKRIWGSFRVVQMRDWSARGLAGMIKSKRAEQKTVPQSTRSNVVL
jgi:hypothetical protein